jgi:isocitrate/isopropylmalate dehydrogenase
MAKAQEVDAVLLGAVGGPKYDKLDFSVKPERGLLRLRKEMDLFANLRPAQCFDALADFSSLKKDVVAGLDIMIVRELTSGVYFGEPRGIIEGNERVGINTQRYTESEIARVARSAFELARSGQQGLLDGKGQRDGIGRAVARRRDRDAPRRSTPMWSCRTCMPTPARCSCAAGPSSST